MVEYWVVCIECWIELKFISIISLHSFKRMLNAEVPIIMHGYYNKHKKDGKRISSFWRITFTSNFNRKLQNSSFNVILSIAIAIKKRETLNKHRFSKLALFFINWSMSKGSEW